MRQPDGFAQGVGAGAALMVVLTALVLASRGRRPLAAALRKMDDAARSGRSPWTGRPPPNYLDLCRTAGL
ncbi:MAG: hypothetical protein LC796_11535 [Acidobacteria bacterium]|nr:hypothetical protein [Acidobacteriota bacterium]MCA1610579.1 hypothetical protein [Acidobacteriota bacterium]MCA1617458.1 hypothetical protein [Acidobacteriota bacterium]